MSWIETATESEVAAFGEALRRALSSLTAATKSASDDYTARIAALDAARKAAIAEQVRCSDEAENLRLLQRWRPVIDDLAIAEDDEFLRIAKDNGLA